VCVCVCDYLYEKKKTSSFDPKREVTGMTKGKTEKSF